MRLLFLILFFSSIVLLNKCEPKKGYSLFNASTLHFDENGELLWDDNVTLRIKKGLIDTVYNNELPIDFPKKNNHVDLQNHYIIPGLIDSHIHLTLKETKNCSEVKDFLGKYLQNGITTVVDLGISEEIENCLERDKNSPNILTAGNIYESYAKNSCNLSYVSCPSNIQNAKKSVLNSYKKGRKIIKIRNMTPDSEVRNALIKQARKLDMIVVEHQSALFRRVEIFEDKNIEKPDVFAHAPPEKFRKITEFTNDYKTHSFLLDSMKQRGMGVISTIVVNKDLESQNGGLLILKMAEGKEVPVALGTDSGFGDPHGAALHKEYDLVAKSLSWTSALKAATYDAAKLFKINDSLGSIRSGKIADLVVLHKLPTNLSNLQDICMVIKSGEVVYKSDTCDRH
jgi:hypothetical protein